MQFPSSSEGNFSWYWWNLLGGLVSTNKIGFDSIVSTNKNLINKETPIWGGQLKFGCLRTQLIFFQSLIEFIEGLIVRKLTFWS